MIPMNTLAGAIIDLLGTALLQRIASLETSTSIGSFTINRALGGLLIVVHRYDSFPPITSTKSRKFDSTPDFLEYHSTAASLHFGFFQGKVLWYISSLSVLIHFLDLQLDCVNRRLTTKVYTTAHLSITAAHHGLPIRHILITAIQSLCLARNAHSVQSQDKGIDLASTLDISRSISKRTRPPYPR